MIVIDNPFDFESHRVRGMKYQQNTKELKLGVSEMISHISYYGRSTHDPWKP